MSTGLGCYNHAPFCRDQLQVAESTVGRGGALGRLARATLHATAKTDSKKSVVEAVSVHIYTVNIGMP